jgi:RNA polymerase sigma factor (TIGR02999 family)
MPDHDITTILEEWGRGDPTAIERLAPLVLPHLREVASSFIRRERQGHTLQATALVNELFLKLLVRREARFENRRHFYVLAAKLMRLALIDHSRVARAEKRGGDGVRVPLHDDLPWVDVPSDDMLDLDRALVELAALDAEQAEMFELRFLIGCSAEETAGLLGLSKSSVDRKIRLARGWLYQRLRPRDASAADSSPSST